MVAADGHGTGVGLFELDVLFSRFELINDGGLRDGDIVEDTED